MSQNELRISSVIDGAVFNASGRMSLAEKFFSGGKSYRVITGNFIKENRRFSQNNSFLFNFFRVLAWATIIPGLCLCFLRSRERSKKNYHILPDSYSSKIDPKYSTVKDTVAAAKKNGVFKKFEDPKKAEEYARIRWRKEKQDILLSFRETKLNISGEEILKNNMDKVDEAYNRLIKHNELLKKRYGASLFGFGKELEKGWFVDQIKDGICFGLNKALEKLFIRHSHLTDEQVKKYLTSEGLIDSLQHQMYHVLFTNVPLNGLADRLKRSFLKEVDSYKISYPNSSNSNFLSKKESIVDIRSKISNFSRQIDQDNLESFNVVFYSQVNPSLKNSEKKDYSNHIIRVQRDRTKGFRIFDQFLGISKWLNNEDFADCLKMTMLTDHYHLCTLNK